MRHVLDCAFIGPHTRKNRQDLEELLPTGELEIKSASLISALEQPRRCCCPTTLPLDVVSDDGEADLSDLLAPRSPPHSPHTHAEMNTPSPKHPRLHTAMRSHAHGICERPMLASPLSLVEHGARRAEQWQAMANADLSLENEALLADLQWQELVQMQALSRLCAQSGGAGGMRAHIARKA